MLLLTAFLLLPLACSRDEVVVPDDPHAPGIYIQANLFTVSPETKAKGEDDGTIHRGDEVNANDAYRENLMQGMDVFFHEVGQPETAPWFQEYHFSGTIVSGDDYFLASNWSELGVDPYKDYDVYVCINNPHTHECAVTPAADVPANLAELKALSTHGYITDSNSIPETEFFIFPPGTDYYGNPKGGDRLFLMDGKAANWHIDRSTSRQVIAVDVKRAAAKVIVNIEFDNTNKTVSLINEDETRMVVNGVEVDYDPDVTPDKGTFIEYLDYIGRMPSPSPRWKYVNYGLEVADIADGTYEVDLDNFTDQTISSTHSLQTAPWFNSLSQLSAQRDYRLEKFRIVSYIDPFSWKGNTEKTPFDLFSITYQHYTDNGNGTYTLNPDREDWLLNYYRFPVCNEAETDSKLERNNIYIINVKISSLGSSETELELVDEQVFIEYHVVPWNQTETTQEATTISAVDTKYLTVTPKTYTLKGDDTQYVNFQWFASVSVDDGRFVDLEDVKVSYVNYEGNTVYIENSPTKSPASPDGTEDITISSTAPNNSSAKGEKTTIKLTTGGLIMVSSEALKSRAVKKIEFTVRLKDPKGAELTDKVTVYHYPLDNIQSFEGLWSSRWDGVSTTQVVRQYSFNPTADGWDTWDGYEDDVECSLAEYNSAESEHRHSSTSSQPTGTPSNYDSASTIESGTNNSTMQTAFRNAVPQNSRSGASSETNAYKDSDSDYWYWGTNQTNGANTNYDWYTGTLRRTYYRWSTYYRRIYYKTVTAYYARRYYREETVTSPASTGSWVAWGEKNGTTSEGNSGIFTAKVYYNGKCYQISNYNTRGSAYDNLTNNHMYVIQITSTSDKYVLGYPILDNNYQSQDKVVAPAFMIASQLGAVTPANSATTAATHCGTYMEVGTDGTRYVGWRLPTKQEIEVIIDYQNGENTHNITMVEVLGGQYYWALDGTSAYVSTGDQGTATNAYVRCVRSLTLDEVEQLNSKND